MKRKEDEGLGHHNTEPQSITWPPAGHLQDSNGGAGQREKNVPGDAEQMPDVEIGRPETNWKAFWMWLLIPPGVASALIGWAGSLSVNQGQHLGLTVVVASLCTGIYCGWALSAEIAGQSRLIRWIALPFMVLGFMWMAVTLCLAGGCCCSMPAAT